MKNYNPFPLGQISKELQRPEPEMIREKGYEWYDPRDIVAIFEKKVADFAGSKYAVAVDCCTHGLFLALKYLEYAIPDLANSTVIIPAHTYISIPLMIRQAGFYFVFRDTEWSGYYELEPFNIFDAAVQWKKDMYLEQKGSTMVISFQIKKRIPIGRGGMILTDNKDEYDWLKLASYDGRDLKTSYHLRFHLRFAGWHFYMTPEDAARGIILMDTVTEEGDSGGWQNYPNLKEYDFFKKANK